MSGGMRGKGVIRGCRYIERLHSKRNNVCLGEKEMGEGSNRAGVVYRMATLYVF